MLPFADLKAQRYRLGGAIEEAITRVLDHGHFILGPEVVQLEEKLADFTGAKAVITCANGTDALILALKAQGIGPGMAVLVPALTFVATAEAVAQIGASPVFIDVTDETALIEGHHIESGIHAAHKAGLDPRAIIPVDLYGHPAINDQLRAQAKDHKLCLISDAAQSLGADISGKRVGTLADMTATSFFPSKPLGCYGDGGAVLTDDENLICQLRSLRVHGSGRHKNDAIHIGLNSRLDTLQAAILLVKLEVLSQEIDARNAIANRYYQGLNDYVRIMNPRPDTRSAWGYFTIATSKRDSVCQVCLAAGIPTRICYPIALPDQSAYQIYPIAEEGVPYARKLVSQVLSLPMHPDLDQNSQDYIIDVILQALKKN